MRGVLACAAIAWAIAAGAGLASAVLAGAGLAGAAAGLRRRERFGERGVALRDRAVRCGERHHGAVDRHRERIGADRDPGVSGVFCGSGRRRNRVPAGEGGDPAGEALG